MEMARQPTIKKGRCYKATNQDGSVQNFVVLEAPPRLVVICEGQTTRTIFQIQPGMAVQEIDPHSMGRNSADDVAQWMWSTFQRDQFLDQQDAAVHIAQHFGNEFVYTTERRNLGISRSV